MASLFSKLKPKTNEPVQVPNGKVIAFLNQKGGVGKTTMAYNTAFALAEQGHKVLCLDLDPQSNLSLLFGAEKTGEHHLHHLLINSIRELAPLHVSSLVGDILVRKGNVDLLPTGQELSGFELTVAGISAPRQMILKRFFEKNDLLNEYDYIIVDCPPTLGLLVVNILCASQGVMIPFRPDEFSRKGLAHFYEVLEDVTEMGLTRTPDVLAHIPNMVDLRRKQEVTDLEKISSEMAEGTTVEPFFNRAQLVKSQAQRKSVYDFKGKDFKQLQGQFTNLANIITNWNEHYEL
ncbi:MAG: ParA family protein [Bacteriovoracaceae bacterium]|nr:ParA family protein [Bacteriovoracaceae bacterium]